MLRMPCLGFLALLLALVSPALANDELWCYDADQVLAEVQGSTVTVYHLATVYNCCPDEFDYAVELAQDEIWVWETEILTMPCDCWCCFDLAAQIEDVPPGLYTLRFLWYDYESEDWREESLPIEVPGTDATGPLTIASVYNSGCLDTATVSEDWAPAESETWGRIKALYR